MWTVQITQIEADDIKNDMAKVTYQYSHTDGRKESITERISEPSSIAEIARHKLAELNRIDAVANLIANPTLGDVFLPVDPDQSAKAVFNMKRTKLVTAKEDLALGLITQSEFDAIKAEAIDAKV